MHPDRTDGDVWDKRAAADIGSLMHWYLDVHPAPASARYPADLRLWADRLVALSCGVRLGDDDEGDS
jgi:hypothetical protein